MSDNNDKWLDEIISKTINTNKPQFDAEKWKQKFPDELRVLQSRANNPQRTTNWITLLRSPITKFTTAAVIILVIGLLVFRPGLNDKTDTPKVTNVTQTPAYLTTIASLNFAYRYGGMELVEKKFDKALQKVGQKPADVSMQEFYKNIKY